MSILNRPPELWTLTLDRVFGEDWEARRAFAERWLAADPLDRADWVIEVTPGMEGRSQ